MGKSCVLCGSAENRVVFHEFGVDVLKCRGCGHVFSAWDADQDYDGYFGTETLNPEEQTWWDAAHRDMYDGFCKRFVAGRGGTLLDVGCGLGFFIRHMNAYAGWKALGCEISPTAVAFARDKLGLKNIHCGKVEDGPFERGAFDIITLWDVIEHIPDPHPFLSSLAPFLKEDGMLFLHTPNVLFQLAKAKVKKMFRGMDPAFQYLEARDHMNIYSMGTISRLLHRHGFRGVRFIHLKPIQSVSGSPSHFLRLLKNMWFLSSVSLFWMTAGRVNLDNFFVVSRR